MRDHEHLSHTDAKFKTEQEQLSRLQQRPVCQRNRGGTDFDIINFRYDDSDGGRQLAQKVSYRNVTLVQSKFCMQAVINITCLERVFHLLDAQ